MSPDEVIEKLEKLNVTMTRRTLLNYEKWELIPVPKRGGGGTGGRWTDYPEEHTVQEAYAAWALIHGVYGDEKLKERFNNNLPKIGIETIKNARSVAILKEKAIGQFVHSRQKYNDPKSNASQFKQLVKKLISINIDDYFRSSIRNDEELLRMLSSTLKDASDLIEAGEKLMESLSDLINLNYLRSVDKVYEDFICAAWLDRIDFAIEKLKTLD